MTRQDFDDKCAELCKTCAAGIAVRYRSDTREYVHDVTARVGPGTQFSHSLCQANAFRKVAAIESL